jgi:hypothetical protein
MQPDDVLGELLSRVEILAAVNSLDDGEVVPRNVAEIVLDVGTSTLRGLEARGLLRPVKTITPGKFKYRVGDLRRVRDGLAEEVIEAHAAALERDGYAPEVAARLAHE